MLGFTRALSYQALKEHKTHPTDNTALLCVALRNLIRNVVIQMARKCQPIAFSEEYEKIAQALNSAVDPLGDWNFPPDPAQKQLILDRIDELTMKVDRLIAKRQDRPQWLGKEAA